VNSPCGSTPIDLTVSLPFEAPPSPKLVIAPSDVLTLSPVEERSLHNLVRAHSTRVEPRVCISTSVSPSHGTWVSLLELQMIPETAREGEEVGGIEHFLISGYRETEPGDCSLGETLESLVPLLCVVDSMVPLSTF
jgi:hypothetical protein